MRRGTDTDRERERERSNRFHHHFRANPFSPQRSVLLELSASSESNGAFYMRKTDEPSK
jgi:hypothetical protein